MEHQADVHPQLRLILPDAGPGCEKNGRRATWPVTTRSGRHQVPVAVLPTAKSLSAFSLKPQSDRLLGERIRQMRKLRGLTQESLADIAKIDRSYVGGVEGGERNLTFTMLCQLCEALECDVAALTVGLPEIER